MKEGKELYKQAELPAGMDVEPCPVCGADAELWQYSNDFKNGPIDKLIMCSNGDRFGPQDGAMNEGCLLYMPPQDFYRGRIAEAVKFWNQYARALNAQRRERNWKRAKVLRTGLRSAFDHIEMASLEASHCNDAARISDALAYRSDDTALRQAIRAAKEEMRERCARVCERSVYYIVQSSAASIRALEVE